MSSSVFCCQNVEEVAWCLLASLGCSTQLWEKTQKKTDRADLLYWKAQRLDPSPCAQTACSKPLFEHQNDKDGCAWNGT